MSQALDFPPPPAEEAISFFSSDDRPLLLEGQITEGSARWGAIVCHPHPLHQGTMRNKVVDTTIRALASHGGTTLRFNFRGVGESEGLYGEGIEEVHDLRGAIRLLRDEYLVESVVIAGFSFGSGVVCRYMEQDGDADAALLLGPPLGKWQLPVFSPPAKWGVHMILGEHDKFCTPAQLDAYAEQFAEVRQKQVVAEAGHFFHGHLPSLVSFVHGVGLS